MKSTLTIISIIFAHILFAQSGNITVKIINIKNDKGYIQIGLYNTEDSFLDYNKTFMSQSSKAKEGTIEYTFTNVPEGTYAIAVWHDENNNEELDKNFFGIPKEDYGFSLNKSGSLGPPDYKDVSFKLKNNESKTLDIFLK